jgi:hypothetical protein
MAACGSVGCRRDMTTNSGIALSCLLSRTCHCKISYPQYFVCNSLLLSAVAGFLYLLGAILEPVQSHAASHRLQQILSFSPSFLANPSGSEAGYIGYSVH